MKKSTTRSILAVLCTAALMWSMTAFVTGCATGSQEAGTSGQAGETQQKAKPSG